MYTVAAIVFYWILLVVVSHLILVKNLVISTVAIVLYSVSALL
jgi:hypothetical protein